MKSWIQKFVWTNLQHLGVLGVVGLIFEIQLLHWFLLFYLFGLVKLFQSLQEAENEAGGKSLFPFYMTFILSQFNPIIFSQVLFQNLGQIYILIRNYKGLPDKNNYHNKNLFHLPFKGKWMVYNGGSVKQNSHSWEILTQRYAYDFVIADEGGKTFKNDGKELTDYYCFNKEILAPADGKVVKINNLVRDYPGVGDLSVDWKVIDFRGNFIIIEHSTDEYSFIAHIRKNSFLVNEGDWIKKGQVIGRCGNSGHSTEPHIHYHLQNRKTMWFATGLPVKFNNVEVEDKGLSYISDYIEKNQRVSNIVTTPSIKQLPVEPC